MSDMRARVVLDAPVSEEGLVLLTPALSQEIAEEVRTVFQNALIAKGVGTRYESESSRARLHVHESAPCGTCREHTLDGLTSY